MVLSRPAAALSVWQLRLYGSPLTPTADGGTDVDPIAVVAPALSLVAVVLLALLLFPRVASLDELATTRAGVARILAARTVARRLQTGRRPHRRGRRGELDARDRARLLGDLVGLVHSAPASCERVAR